MHREVSLMNSYKAFLNNSNIYEFLTYCYANKVNVVGVSCNKNNFIVLYENTYEIKRSDYIGKV